MKIIILDYSDATISIMDYLINDEEEAEDFLTENQFRPEDCHWMIFEELKLTIK